MTTENKILNALTEHSELTKGELKDICGVTDFQLNNSLGLLVVQGKIKRIKQGVYALDRSNYTDPQQTSLFGE